MSDSIYSKFKFDNISCISVGELDSDKVALFNRECPEAIANLNSRTIIMWKDRVEHIEKHGYDASELTVEELCDKIPEIIRTPDYIGYRKKDGSMQFIKAYNNNILVAVRVDRKGNLKFRTVFTITDSQLSDYITKGSVWKFAIDK